jgi:RNA polymerase sigma-70 factor, ECF subfamily
MELTYSARRPEDLLLFGVPPVESACDASEGDARSSLRPHAENQFDPAIRAFGSTSVVNYGDASDEHLVEAARSGDDRAFVELSNRCAGSLRRRLFAILRNREDAEDSFQDALLRAYSHLGQFRGDTSRFSTWLTRIAINSALMRLRKKRSRYEVSLQRPGEDDQSSELREFTDPSPSVERMYAKHQTVDLLANTIKRLPLRHQSIINQYHVQERSLEEIAQALGITVSAAKSRLMRARLTMRSSLETMRMSLENAYL